MPKITEVQQTMADLEANRALMNRVIGVDLSQWPQHSPIEHAIRYAVYSRHIDTTSMRCLEEYAAYKVGACLATYAVDKSIGSLQGIDRIIGLQTRASMVKFDQQFPRDPYRTVIEEATRVSVGQTIEDHPEAGPLLQGAYDHFNGRMTVGLGNMACWGVTSAVNIYDGFWDIEEADITSRILDSITDASRTLEQPAANPVV